jgi:hypothetical protein
MGGRPARRGVRVLGLSAYGPADRARIAPRTPRMSNPEKGQNMILVTTAGKVGSEAARLLTQRDESVRVLVRKSGEGDRAEAAGSGRRRGRPRRPGDDRRSHAGGHVHCPGQPSDSGSRAQRDRQCRSYRGWARREDHQQGSGGLADRSATRTGRDRSRADRLRAELHPPAQQLLHAELPHACARDRTD